MRIVYQEIKKEEKSASWQSTRNNEEKGHQIKRDATWHLW